MMTSSAANNRYKVAIPYYGDLSHPVRGLSNLYYLLEVNPENQTIAESDISVWTPATDNDLSSWLVGNGVRALFCNQIDPDHKRTLNHSGILIESHSNSNLLDSVVCWLKETGAALFTHNDAAEQAAWNS